MRSDSERRTIKELGFKRWCSEVLFYHYKWHIIGAAAAIVVVVLLFSLNAGVPDNDAVVIVAVSQTLDGEVINELKVEIGRILGDKNGDGQVIINVLQYLLNPRDGVYDSTVTGNATTMVTSFLNDEMVLYLFDRVNLNNTIRLKAAVLTSSWPPNTAEWTAPSRSASCRFSSFSA